MCKKECIIPKENTPCWLFSWFSIISIAYLSTVFKPFEKNFCLKYKKHLCERDVLVHPITFWLCQSVVACLSPVLSSSMRTALLARTNGNSSFQATKDTKRPPPVWDGGLLVYPIGFEPTAPSVGGLCSIQLSYGYVFSSFILLCFPHRLQAFL